MSAKHNDIDKVLQRIHRERVRRFDFQSKQRIAELKDYGRRRKRAVKMRERVLRQGLDEAGISLDELSRLHAKDNQDAAAFHERQMVKVQEYARGLAQQRGTMVQQLHDFLKRHFGQKSGNPSYRVPIKAATDVRCSTHFYNGSVTTPELSKGHLDNWVRTSLSATSDSYPSLAVCTVYFDFVWVADRSGIAEAVAWLSLNGMYSLYAHGSCFSVRDARVSIGASVTVSQPVSARGVGQYSNEQRLVNESVRAAESPRGTSRVIFDATDFRFVNRTGVPIVGGLPVIVTATLTIECSADEDARAQVDASADPVFALIVPSVVLMVD